MKKLVLAIISLMALFHFSESFAESKITKAKLHELARKNHLPHGYSDIKKILFSTVDNQDGLVCSVYTEGQCQKRYYRPVDQLNLKSLNMKYKKPKGFKLNIEHTWPQSKGAKELPANSDMHHLFVTSKESNSKRANLPFCNVESAFWEFGGSAMGINYYAQDCFEPRDAHKGNVARAMFYFSTRYLMKIDSDQEEVFRQWHQQDPVDQAERDRNLVIQKIQGNINPFILNPEYVELIKDF